MDRRLQLQTLLEHLLGEAPEKKLKVYFQPNENVKMTYPCIVYSRDYASTQFAQNVPYRFEYRYQITVITQASDDVEISDQVRKLPKTLFARNFVSDGLNHDIFNTYF